MMKYLLFVFLCSISLPLFAQDSFQLAPPLLKYNSVFFIGKTNLEIKFAQTGTAVHYTLNGKEPTIKDLVYKRPISVTNNFTSVKAKTFGKAFKPSESVAVTFIKDGKKIRTVEQTAPNPKYPGSGANTLIDNKGGDAQTNSNTWLGYNCDTVSITLNLEKEETVNNVLLNFLQNEGGWIFLPEKINVSWFDKTTNSLQYFGSEAINDDKETPGSQCNFHIIQPGTKLQTNKIIVQLVVKKKMPAWHSNKGEHAWMFIDEIKVY